MVNLNFWVTNDDANEDKESGGLVVFNKQLKGVAMDGIGGYNNHDINADTMGLTDKDIKMRVPYKQNRAVLFHSSYFHQTDRHKFKPGYTNRRINYTLLFGFLESFTCQKSE